MTKMPPIDLLDVNVWVALSDEDHPHHQKSKSYWEELRAGQIAFCRITVLGVLRLLTHSKVMAGNPFTVQEAWNVYRAFKGLPEVVFIAEPADFDQEFEALTQSPNFSSMQWTDGYLATLAIGTGCRFDGDFRNFKGLAWLHLS